MVMASRKLHAVLIRPDKLSLRCRSLFKPLTSSISGRTAVSINGRAVSITLVWSFAAFGAFHFAFEELISRDARKIVLLSGIVAAVFSFLLGFAGDVYCGRHMVIRCSLCVLFVAAILNTLGFAFHSQSAVQVGVFILLIGFFGFYSCIIPFSLDQLYDSSSDEVITYIIWVVWTFYASSFLIEFSQACVCIDDDKALASLLLPVLLTFALCSDFFFGHLLVKEPVTHNPFKLIFQVLKYAVKNKYPRLRSAFTYWDDKRYSRIDLAKTKFGGPFTTEQVEDVKTFFRISTVLFVSMSLIGIPLYAGNFYYSYGDNDCNSSMVISQLEYFKPCFEGRAVIFVGVFLVVVLVPAYLLLLHPLFRRCIPSLSMSKKMCFFLLFLFLRVFSCLSLEMARYLLDGKTYDASNSSISCFRSSPGFDTYTVYAKGLSYYWFALPSMCASFSEFILLVTTIEFLCAQSPYSMRGLLFGFTSSSFILAISVSHLTTVLLESIPNKHILLSCGLWFFMICGVVVVIETVLLCLIGWWYKRRQRDDYLPSQHYFAERYYENTGDN